MNLDRVRDRLMEESVARQVLRTEILPPTALPIYEKDPEVTAYLLGEKGENVLAVSKPENVITPLFSLETDEPFTEDELVAHYAKVELELLLAILDAAAVCRGMEISPKGASEIRADRVTASTLANAFKKVERHSLEVRNVLISQDDIDYVCNALSDVGDLDNDPTAEGKIGFVLGAKVYASSTVPSGYMYVLTDSEFLGAMPIRTQVAGRNPEQETFASLGMIVWNPRGVCRITF